MRNGGLRLGRAELASGYLRKKYLTCGKAECRCAQGNKHGPYYYLRTYRKGKKRQTYVPRGTVARVRESIRRRNAARDQLRQVSIESMRIWRQIKQTLKELEQ